HNLNKAGFSLCFVSALDAEGRTTWIVDAHRNGKRFVVRADEILTAFWNSKLRSRVSVANSNQYQMLSVNNFWRFGCLPSRKSSRLGFILSPPLLETSALHSAECPSLRASSCEVSPHF